MDEGTGQKSEIEQFFSVLQAKRESFAEFMRHFEPTLAPRFNLFDFIYPDENKLSEIIAFLLKQDETHGQGDKFLNIFLDAIGRSDIYNSTAKVECRLEKTTDMIEASRRRIDIELKVDDFCLAFENKPWASDQDKQIEAYNEQLETCYGNRYLLIYLSGSGEDPSEESVSEEKREALKKSGHLKVFPYRDFISCVNRFKMHCQSDRVRFFLQDFEDYLTIQFGGGVPMYDKEMIKEYVRSSGENLEIAHIISRTMDDIKQELLKELKNILGKNWHDLKLEWNIEDLWSKYQNFSFTKDIWNGYKITFEFEGTQCRFFGYGVSKNEENLPDIEGIGKDDKLGAGRRSSWWPWYRYFEPPYDDWSIHHEPWVDILNGGGELVEKITKEVKRIADVLDQLEFDSKGMPSFRKI